MSIALSVKCQNVLNFDFKIKYPIYKVDEFSDSVVVFSLEQARKIDFWLNEKEYLEGKVGRQEKAISSAKKIIEEKNKIINYSEEIRNAEKQNFDLFKIKAKKRNRNKIIIISSSVLLNTVLIGILIN